MKEGFYHFSTPCPPPAPHLPTLTIFSIFKYQECMYKEINVSENSNSYNCSSHPNHIQIPLKTICKNGFSQQLRESQWKESYQRKILISRKHTKRTCVRQFQSRTGESRKEKDKEENIYTHDL